MLSEYQRMVETPMRKSYEATIRDLRSQIEKLVAERDEAREKNAAYFDEVTACYATIADERQALEAAQAKVGAIDRAFEIPNNLHGRIPYDPLNPLPRYMLGLASLFRAFSRDPLWGNEEQAEHAARLVENAALRLVIQAAALKPFSDAWIGFDDSDPGDDHGNIWEHPIAMEITMAHLRNAHKALAEGGGS